jgi:CheY-like chemotaxis protein
MAELKRILLVEDNVELRNLYVLFLKDHQFQVYTANDGKDGLEKAKEHKPDLIFLDIMMPKMVGFEVLKILKHDPSYGCTATKIVMLTNFGDSTKLNPQIKQDMDGYVIKAEIALSDLLDVIHSLEK